MCFGNIIYGGKHDRYKAYLGVWLRLFFEVFFILKYIKIIFFIFKNYF